MNMDHMNAALESIADLARTLKEERDAALADATALAERLTVLELTSTSELARLERERDEAREDAEYWKDSLKLLGETPEQVFESWRIRHTKVFKYIRLMVSWREKYNISKKEAEYYRERDEAKAMARVKLITPQKNTPVAEYFSSSSTPETNSAFKFWPCEQMELVDAEFARKLERERDEARGAIIATLEENRHLADGDDCTLAKLKSVVPDWK